MSCQWKNHLIKSIKISYIFKILKIIIKYKNQKINKLIVTRIWKMNQTLKVIFIVKRSKNRVDTNSNKEVNNLQRPKNDLSK